MKTVTSITLLKAMAKEGLVTFHEQTGTKISGLYGGKKFTCCYVWEAKSNFIFRGKKYTEKYFSGCFMPYVVELD